MQKENYNELLAEFIKLYHKNFFILYSNENLKRLECENQIDNEKFIEFKNYFTNSIYPIQNNREKLDLAFATLKKFVFSPKLVLLILGKISLSLLQSKINITDIIKISHKTLNYYNYVINFEKKIIKVYVEVKKDNIKQEAQFKETLKKLPKKELYENLNQTIEFLSILESKKFIQNLIQILESLLSIVIKDKYCNVKEMEGLKLVINMVKDGSNLLTKFTDKQIRTLINLIKKVESDFLENL